MTKPTITAKRLREVMHYSPKTDAWIRIASHMRPDRVGLPVTAKDEKGYYRTRIDGRKYRLHQLVWLWHTGEFPAFHLDHVDGNPQNNRIENLRIASRSVNAQNQRTAHSNNLLGVQGVRRFKNKFKSRISFQGRRLELGTYATAEEAYAAYVKAKRVLHPGNTL